MGEELSGAYILVRVRLKEESCAKEHLSSFYFEGSRDQLGYCYGCNMRI